MSPRRRALAFALAVLGSSALVMTVAASSVGAAPGTPGALAAPARPGPGGDFQGYDTPNPPGGPTDKVVSLTFDDGPNATWTPQVLAVLERYGVRATFFEIGRQAERSPDVVKAVVAAGSVVGNHTWDHAALNTLDDQRFAFEVDHTTEVLEGLAGQHIACLRPPYGASDPTTVQRLAARGLTSMLWTADSQDYTRPGVAKIVANALDHLQPGGVILFHDGGGDRGQTVAALPQVIERIRAAGYRIAPVCTPDPHAPIGGLSSVQGAHPGRITATGWASDPDSHDPISVHLYMDGTYVADAMANGPGRPGPTWTGAFVARPGTHTICAYAINVGLGTSNPSIGCETADVPAITTFDDLRPLAAQARVAQLQAQALLLQRVAELEGRLQEPWRVRAAILLRQPVRALAL